MLLSARSFSDVNECDSSPCEFGGECKDLQNAFQCACQPGSAGIRCFQGKIDAWKEQIKVSSDDHAIIFDDYQETGLSPADWWCPLEQV